MSALGLPESWGKAYTTWLDGNILTEEMRRLVTNFSSVTSVRPQDEAVAGANSQDDASDAEAFVGLDELDDVSITRRGGGCRRGGEQEEQVG